MRLTDLNNAVLRQIGANFAVFIVGYAGIFWYRNVLPYNLSYCFRTIGMINKLYLFDIRLLIFHKSDTCGNLLKLC